VARHIQPRPHMALQHSSNTQSYYQMVCPGAVALSEAVATDWGVHAMQGLETHPCWCNGT
jgi:hypothetical protein